MITQLSLRLFPNNFHLFMSASTKSQVVRCCSTDTCPFCAQDGNLRNKFFTHFFFLIRKVQPRTAPISLVLLPGWFFPRILLKSLLSVGRAPCSNRVVAVWFQFQMASVWVMEMLMFCSQFMYLWLHVQSVYFKISIRANSMQLTVFANYSYICVFVFLYIHARLNKYFPDPDK